MLEVQKFLMGATRVQSNERALESLKEQTGIKASIWEDKLVVLNYCQIESKKTCAMAQECRSLVLELGSWKIVSRSFNRFFNYGEEPCPAIDIQYMTAFEKMDGSLIGLFEYDGEWMYRTRSVIMPVSGINGWEVTWKSHIEQALGHLYMLKGGEVVLNPRYTYIMEMTSPENRVVTKYASPSPQMTLLASRHNEKGHYNPLDVNGGVAHHQGWGMPKAYSFDTISDCLTAAKELRDLQEGYVLYDRHGVPVCKLKNPAYVAAHHLRGEGLNPKRIKDLIIMNEVSEYLAIFPEDRKMFEPYMDAYRDLGLALFEYLDLSYDTDLTQKEFALKIAHLPFKGVLFTLRKDRLGVTDAWKKCTTNTKYQLIDGMMK
jgi:hypothetical protein